MVRVWSKEDEAYPTPSLCGDGDGCVCAAGRGGSPEPCFASRAASARRRPAIRAPPAKHRADDVKARHSQRPARAPFHARTRARACRTAVPCTLGARASERARCEPRRDSAAGRLIILAALAPGVEERVMRKPAAGLCARGRGLR